MCVCGRLKHRHIRVLNYQVHSFSMIEIQCDRNHFHLNVFITFQTCRKCIFDAVSRVKCAYTKAPRAIKHKTTDKKSINTRMKNEMINQNILLKKPKQMLYENTFKKTPKPSKNKKNVK